MPDAKPQELRSKFGGAFKIKISSLEDFQPWRSRTENGSASGFEELELMPNQI